MEHVGRLELTGAGCAVWNRFIHVRYFQAVSVSALFCRGLKEIQLAV